MSLLVFLVITILLCSLILLAQSGESKPLKYGAVAALVLQVLFLLFVRDVISPSLPFRPTVIIPCCTAALGILGIFKLSDRSIPMLIFFASLVQFFMETGVIEELR